MKKTENIIVVSFVMCLITAFISGAALNVVKFTASQTAVSIALVFMTATFILWIISISFAIAELIHRISN